MLKPGDRIGDWVVDSVLGEGGMGAVYKVHSALTDRLEAALKVMKPTIAEDARRRFVREAEALSALRHPAIVRVMGFSEDPSRGLLYLVMELAKGETLKDRLARGPMSLPEALRTFVPLASALDHAHQSGIFHRDLKPANVVLTEDGTPRLVDFGVAVGNDAHMLTGAAGQMGTLAYLPPEVFRGMTAEPGAIDVYAFGLLLHEALTGQRSYAVEAGLTPAAAAAAVGVRKLQQARHELPPTFPQGLRDAVAAATDPDPAKRPGSQYIRETLQSLIDRRARAGVSGPATPISPYVPTPAPVAAPPPVAPKPPRPAPPEHTMRVPDPPPPPLGQRLADASRGKRGIVAGAVVLLLIALGLGFAFNSRDRDEPPARKIGVAEEPRQTAPATTLPPATMAAYPSQPPVTTPLGGPVPAMTPAAIPTPSAAAPGPVISVSPAPGAWRTMPPMPSPSPRAETGPVPVPPAPVVVQPEVVPDEPEDEGPVERMTPPPRGRDLTGSWELSNRVVSTSYDAYRGLNLGYRLTLRQDGQRVTGTGVKVSENGSPVGQRTPIRVTGRIEGDSVVLSFTEEGAERSSGGTFRWRISSDGTSLRGSFFSDAANTNGPSSARRVD